MPVHLVHHIGQREIVLDEDLAAYHSVPPDRAHEGGLRADQPAQVAAVAAGITEVAAEGGLVVPRFARDADRHEDERADCRRADHVPHGVDEALYKDEGQDQDLGLERHCLVHLPDEILEVVHAHLGVIIARQPPVRLVESGDVIHGGALWCRSGADHVRVQRVGYTVDQLLAVEVRRPVD
eukprot:CAMPEP_0180042682 /NCGR_PEP_ID=MMETSP0984-20121128/34875_1 /TAXON_ID=483367 /ORGANISM="non described non described, Strain CCMP 2436" /LENGTH=180 /DNA_ID=CAMNT_0021970509 /DNA_START=402 /DNA_END=944 /DNA_ORIENTATION=-